MKSKIFYIIIFFWGITLIPFTIYGNTNTKEYCQSLMDSAHIEYAKTNYAKSLELLTEAKFLAETNNWDDYKMRALSNIGLLYSALSDLDKAMEYYLEAYKIVVKMSHQEGEMILLNNIAGIYYSEKKFDQATQYYQRVLAIAKQLNDTAQMIKTYSSLSFIANEEGNYDLSTQYADICLSIAKVTSSKENIFIATCTKMESLYAQKAYPAAEKLASNILEEHKNELIKAQHTVFLFVLISKIYLQLNDTYKALSIAQEASKYAHTLEEWIIIYEQLSDIYWRNNSSVLAWMYKDSVLQFKDSSYKINVRDNLESNRIRFELLNSEKALSESKAEQRAERILFFVLLVFFALLTIISIWVFRIQSIRNRQKKQITELELQHEKNQNLLKQEQLNNENLRLEQQLKDQESTALLKQERLTNELDARNRQLTAKVLSQSNKNEIIKDIIKSLSDIPEHADIVDAIIRKLKIQLNESSQWENFLTSFEQMNPALLVALDDRHPYLSANDIQLLACIYLGLDTKTTAHLLNISLEACKKKKQRLASRMELKVNDFHDYLKKITIDYEIQP
jgi:hypothetical protein